jgi:hypothetical protein
MLPEVKLLREAQQRRQQIVQRREKALEVRGIRDYGSEVRVS